jgi:hypothetical protein
MVTWLLEALYYKPEGRGFDIPSSNRMLSVDLTFRPHRDPWVYSASNRNRHHDSRAGPAGKADYPTTIYEPIV